MVPLIPRKLLFGNPDKFSVSLSPDGSKIAYLASLDGVLNVWVAPSNEPSKAKAVTHDTHRGILLYEWAYTNDHILYLQDRDGDENWMLYSVDITSGDTLKLTPEGFQARIVKLSHNFPNEILIGLNDRDIRLHDIYRVNVLSGERKVVLQNPGFMSFVADESLKIRLALRFKEGGRGEILQLIGGKWEHFADIPVEDVLTTSPVGFDETGRVLYMVDSRERDTSALVSVDLESGEKRILAQDSKADLSDILFHPTKRTPQAVAFTYARKRWRVLDPDVADDFDYLKGIVEGEITVLSRTLKDDMWLVEYKVDDGPILYYLYNRRERKAHFLFSHRKELENLPLAKMHPVIIKSRDGLNLVSYLTLPPWTDPDGDGKPDRPLPMVLLVHGGPWHRDFWGYNPFHQWLANRGYAVLSVNFRGSTGFGKAFVNASNRQWGGKMHDDLIDAVEWAIENGIADKDRIAIMGGSYGGYATLVGLTKTPDVFSCGVDLVGPSNLITWAENIPPYWEPFKELIKSRVGDIETEEGRRFLMERSPLFHVDRIKKPLLIAHGANDPRVKKQESDQIVDAMREKGLPVVYLFYPDEGHGFVRPENRLSFAAITELFLSKCLGGRYEPIGNDLKGSSLKVLSGADYLPELKTALEFKSYDTA